MKLKKQEEEKTKKKIYNNSLFIFLYLIIKVL